jgi:ABC-type sugar transport system ATPase subunit/ribose/xylose/arabinose/galactoside ABC-type transport system permease subunit
MSRGIGGRPMTRATAASARVGSDAGAAKLQDVDPTPSEERALRVEHVSKAFVGVQALTDVSFSCRPGEIHALVGENGAGKSTLIKVAAGALAPDEGGVWIGNVELSRPSPLRARRLGLLTAYQDTSLVPDLTVADNVLLSFHGRRHMGLHMHRGEIRELLAPYDLPFGPNQRVGDLSPGSRQLLEVVRCLVHSPSVLLLDEPTAALDSHNIGLLELLLYRARESRIAIVYISHRLDEVRRLADRVTVIRDGVIQGTYTDAKQLDVGEIVTLMVGAPTDLVFPPKRVAGESEEAPAVLRTERFRGQNFGPVSVEVRKGEIVGVAGSEGNGQRELVRTIVGLRRGRGTLEIDGAAPSPSISSPGAALRNGISFQSGDRAESVFRELSVMSNSSLVALDRLGPFGMIMRSRERKLFKPVARDLAIAHASPDQEISELSGGNQQKVVLGRPILAPARLVVIDEPTQGVDARSRLDIYRLLRQQADDGTAILVNSSDSAELAGLCDRVYVMSRGRVVRELSGGELTESAIVDAFVSSGPAAAAAAAQAEAEADEDAGTTKRPSRLRDLAQSTWFPMIVLALLIVLVGAYTQSRSDIFLSASNLTSVLVISLPLIIVAQGEQLALITAGVDVSVGAVMTVTVVLASFVMGQAAVVHSVPAIALCIAAGIAIGLLNAFVIVVLGVNSIIATIATMGILAGIGIIARPSPGGEIGAGITDFLSPQIGFLPVQFLVVTALVIAAEFALRRTPAGLTLRAVGLSDEASRRTGVRVRLISFMSYIACSSIAVLAGLSLAVQVGVGSNGVGDTFTLSAFTACFLGGAALTGGRGSFVGAVLGALFLGVMTNAVPLLGLPSSTAQIATGVMTIIAVLAYSVTRRASVVHVSAPHAPEAKVEAA